MNIAVMMSTFNGCQYLREQLDSILEQNGDFDIDILVRDDGSTDETVLILNEYKSKGVLNWYQGENKGSALSFMELVAKVKDYDYYAFADQDDVWNKDKLSVAINALKKDKNANIPKVYCSNALLVDKELSSVGRNVYNSMPRTDFETLSCAGGLLGCTMVYNRALQLELRMCTSHDLRIVMHDFFVALVCVGIGGEIIFDDYASMQYRQHENNVLGIKNGILSIIEDRINNIIRHRKVSISDQAKTLVDIYEDKLIVDYFNWINIVKRYHESLLNRIKLAFSSKTKYINLNMSIKLRTAIILSRR